MKRYTLFIDWKTLHTTDGNSPQIDITGLISVTISAAWAVAAVPFIEKTFLH